MSTTDEKPQDRPVTWRELAELVTEAAFAAEEPEDRALVALAHFLREKAEGRR